MKNKIIFIKHKNNAHELFDDNTIYQTSIKIWNQSQCSDTECAEQTPAHLMSTNHIAESTVPALHTSCLKSISIFL